MISRMSLVISLILVTLLNIGCAGPSVPQQPSPQNIKTPMPQEEGFNETSWDQMMDVIEDLDLPIDSVVVYQHGLLVFEGYPNPQYGPDDLHLLYSVTKSITSALIGIAVEEGFIEGVDQRVIAFFPEWTSQNLDARKEALTIEHLLTMTCGFEWEGPDDNLHTWGQAIRSGDPVRYVLDLPMASDPGTEWVYNGGCSHLLSAILTRTSGLSTLEFARRYLFEPLGITEVKWPRDPKGVYYGGQDIWLKPRDMAKFGQLFLNQGVWEGSQIVSREWVARSSETYIKHWVGGYGYQWWTFPDKGIFYASGAYEQRIYVIPALDMVVVFTADNKAPGLAQGEIRSGTPVVDWLLGRFILPASEAYSGLKYENYGFSMDVPAALQASEYGKSWQGLASSASGMVQYGYGSSPYEKVGVQWDTVNASPDLKLVLNEFLTVVESLVVEINQGDPIALSVKDGHELVTQSFEIMDGEHVDQGVVGAWYCEETGRVYLLYYANFQELSQSLDPLTVFEQLLGDFVCHP